MHLKPCPLVLLLPLMGGCRSLEFWVTGESYSSITGPRAAELTPTGSLSLSTRPDMPRIAANSTVICAIESSEQARCWSSPRAIGTHMRVIPGHFEGVALSGTSHVCFALVGGALVCENPFTEAPPREFPGPIHSVTLAQEALCTVSTDGDLFCEGVAPGWEQLAAPVERVALIGSEAGTALLQDGTLTSWGSRDRKWTPPPGHFVDLQSNASQFCALREDGRLLCWGGKAHQFAPDWTKVEVERLWMSSMMRGCVQRPGTSTPSCWDAGDTLVEALVPAEYSSLTERAHFLTEGQPGAAGCGLTPEDDLLCWNAKGLLQDPYTKEAKAAPPKAAPPPPRNACEALDACACGISKDICQAHRTAIDRPQTEEECAVGLDKIRLGVRGMEHLIKMPQACSYGVTP